MRSFNPHYKARGRRDDMDFIGWETEPEVNCFSRLNSKLEDGAGLQTVQVYNVDSASVREAE